MIVIDGSRGEGGGQILRTSLGLSLVTGEPLRVDKVRANRRKPGLMRQHLTALRAAAEVGGARVEGDSIGSRSLTFRPGAARPGQYHFAVGTAGSATLVLQTVLPALLGADGPSRLILEGGTHNPFAPPFDFLARAYLPLVQRMGVALMAELHRPGFYPAGGGRFEVRVEPAEGGALQPLELLRRGALLRRQARALVSRLPRKIGERELAVVREDLGWSAEECVVQEVKQPQGPGNALLLEIESEQVTEVLVGFGEKGVSAEAVARQAVDQARRYLAADVPVGRHLADQLLIPLALAGGGAFRSLALTRHTTTNIEVVRRFLDVAISTEELGPNDVLVRVG